MKTTRMIGIREAKAKLGRLVRDVREGVEWLITDRGRPVARLVAIEPADLSLDERVKRLEDAGLISRRTRDPKPLPPPIPGGDWAQRYLQEDRDR